MAVRIVIVPTGHELSSLRFLGSCGAGFGCRQPNNMESAYPNPLQWVWKILKHNGG
jgi:hypothetical protein